jgi:hypothetical protein
LPQFAAGVVCAELPNEVNFCFPGGRRALDETCVTHEAAALSGRFDAACAKGLGCVQNSCKTACRADTDCPVGGTCLFAEDDVVARGVGFCGVRCVPFSKGQCGKGQKCLPIDAERGFCVPAGELGPGAACVPGLWQCEEGSICTDYGLLGGQGARCQPMCNIHVVPGGGDIARVDQAKRDATCPQVEPPARAALAFIHAAPLAGAVDVYVDGALWLSAAQAGVVQPEQGWRYLDTGSHTIAARRAGASPQDAPLAERVVALRRDVGTRLGLMDRAGGASWALFGEEVGGAPPQGVRLVWAVPDAGRVEVAALDAAGEELGRVGPLELGSSAALEGAALSATTLAIVAPGAASAQALARLAAPAAGVSLWVVSGTLDPDDEAALTLHVFARQTPELALADALRWTCTSIGNKGYGVCEQQCLDAGDLGRCQGEAMGCQATLRNAVVGAEVLCRPVQTERAEGMACDPFLDTGACGQGLSCVRFGPGSLGLAQTLPGRCVPLCDVDVEGVCGAGRLCVSQGADLFLGRCEWVCTPDRSYADVASCPDGLQTCEPRAEVEETELGEVVVRAAPAICSESGARGLGEQCTGGDCVPGAECLYPRSAQVGLAQGILSPYLGGAGVPTCRAQCDPFDGQRSDAVCGLGETCLPNFPWSADVGHCAPIVEMAATLQPCQRPGESCGVDSVCVTEGAAPFCLRLCQYVGGDGATRYLQSTCSSGEECVPLVADIGYCRPRGG